MSLVDSLGFFDGLLARLHGPMSFRFLIQPAVAIFFGFRDGRRDAREGRAAFFWGLLTDQEHRRDMLRSGWKSVGKVFCIGVALDLVFQYIAFHDLRVVGAVIAGVVLAIVPYLLLRGPVNRLSRRGTGDVQP